MNKQGCRIATALLGFREGFRDYFSNRMRASTAVTYRWLWRFGSKPHSCGFIKNNWIEAILVDCYLGEPALPSVGKQKHHFSIFVHRTLRAAHNKPIENVKSDKQTTDLHLLQ